MCDCAGLDLISSRLLARFPDPAKEDAQAFKGVEYTRGGAILKDVASATDMFDIK